MNFFILKYIYYLKNISKRLTVPKSNNLYCTLLKMLMSEISEIPGFLAPGFLAPGFLAP